jgi:hypothetical protein
MNEDTGTAAHDTSGFANNATLGNGASWNAAGKYGGAISFDGINDWLTVADANSLDLTTGMTLEAWVKPTVLNSWETVILKESGTDLAYSLYADNNGNDRLDVSDASAILRMVTQIDPPRAWDIAANDLNQNNILDAGDAVRVLRVVTDKGVVHKLFAEIAPKYAERPGGYTRIVRAGFRKGDSAPMAIISLVGEGEDAE